MGIELYMPVDVSVHCRLSEFLPITHCLPQGQIYKATEIPHHRNFPELHELLLKTISP